MAAEAAFVLRRADGDCAFMTSAPLPTRATAGPRVATSYARGHGHRRPRARRDAARYRRAPGPARLVLGATAPATHLLSRRRDRGVHQAALRIPRPLERF